LRPKRPAWRAVLVVGLALAAAACSQRAGQASPRRAAAHPHHRSPPTTTSTTSTTSTTAPLGYLTGYGATEADWYQSHTPDPDGGGFYPRLANGSDTYTSVQFVNGRALSYVENFYPPAPLDQALASVGDELPFDAKVVHDAPSPPTSPACQQVVETSPTLRALAGVGVLAELRSATPSLDPTQISEITYQPFTGSLAQIPAC
jgi:hypothetical protein